MSEELKAGTGSDSQENLVDAVTEGSTDEIAEALKLVEGGGNVDPEAPTEEAEVAPETEAQEEAQETAQDEEQEEQETAPDPSVAQGWAQVVKAERQARERMKEVREREKALEARAAQNDALADRIRTDPLSVLREAGFEFNDLARMVLDGGQPKQAPQQPKSEDKEFAAMRERVAKLEAEKQAATEEQYRNAYRGDIRQVLSDPKYKLLASHPDAENEMFEAAAEWAREYGEVRQPEEFAGILQDQYRKELSELAARGPIREALGIGDTTPAEAPAPETPGRTKRPVKPRSLTNNMAASPSKKVDWDSLSDQDLISEAAKLVPAGAWDHME